MRKAEEALDYRSFILVCWVESGQETAVAPLWRFRLEDPHSGQQWGFVTLIEVASFLQAKLDKLQK